MLMRSMVAASPDGVAWTRRAAARATPGQAATPRRAGAAYPRMMVVVALIPLIGGLLVGVGGFLGWQGKLSRDRGTGVRTDATLRSDEAFAVGNKVAGIPTMAAGVVGIVGGLAALAMPTPLPTTLAAVFGVVGLLGLLAAGGVLGNRAAAAVPEPVPAENAAGGCGGCACGAGGCG